jgi:glyoxylase-like metal-dependent hydrolase (beta-lactamase superfamily II)
VERRGIASHALAATVARAAQREGAPRIDRAVASPFALDGLGLGLAGEVFFPGPAHTTDNATVWLAEPAVLVGGCAVRAAEATDMGNTSEADLAAWPRAIAALEARYPGARLVVPGHGEPGSLELLAHTRRLLAQ